MAAAFPFREINVSLFNCLTFPSKRRFISQLSVSLPSSGQALQWTLYRDLDREVCSRIDLLQAYLSPITALTISFSNPPSPLSQQKRNSIFRAWSIESNYKQYILSFPPSDHHSSKSYLKVTQAHKQPGFIYFFHS